jgi:hypothetical protein
MMLLTKAIREKLVKNHRENDGKENTVDFKPVVKLFALASPATWLITEMDPETNLMFGLCDLGHGFPEIGYVSLDELTELKWMGIPRVERDRHWTASGTLSEYAKEARENQRIVD